MYALRVDGAPVRNHGDCPTLDDVVGLYHLYPECDVRATTMPTPPNCNRVDHNTLLFRVFIYAGLPLFALMFALLIFIAVTKYQYRKMLKDYAQFRKDALVTGKRNRDKWLEVKYWEKVHAVEEYVQKRVECTIVMQRFARGALERMHFRAVQKGVLMIQKHVRGMIQREDVCFLLRPQRIRTDPKFRREFMQLHAMMGERSQSLILVKHLEDLEEKLRLYVKALRDGKNFSARKATDKERKLEEECLKELGIGEQSAPTRLDNLAQDLARYILTPKVDESGNLVYLYPDRPSGKRQKQFDRVPRAGKVPAHASALTMWEKTASFLESSAPRTSGADRRTSDDLDRAPERRLGVRVAARQRRPGAPAVVVAQRLAARSGEGRAARAARAVPRRLAHHAGRHRGVRGGGGVGRRRPLAVGDALAAQARARAVRDGPSDADAGEGARRRPRPHELQGDERAAAPRRRPPSRSTWCGRRRNAPRPSSYSSPRRSRTAPCGSR